MDPFEKSWRISLGGHIAIILLITIATVTGEIFKPRPAAVFTVLAPPAGLIAGGPSSTSPQVATPEKIAPQGPKLPSPAPQEKASPPKDVGPKADATPPPAPKSSPKPTARKPSDKGVLPPKRTPAKEKPKARQEEEKISFAEFQRKYGKKPVAKENPKTASKPTSTPKSQVGPNSSPSWQENVASRLDRRLQSDGARPIGTGLGGAPGSGMAAPDGIAGAIDDPEAIYTGSIYTYLNSVWEEPSEAGNIRLNARVEFVVNKDGEITSWRITKRSGVEAFDRSVERVFARVKELNPPPKAMDYRLTVVFETRDS